ncbi:putative DNA-binding domain-containing protein [Marinobacterium aestuariivivens]|uniref:DNA-binding domain-containing protein n=1 Tax=Marinobacterium aestuariivivens TaxID=1698799 RepID=A0ABW1ZVL4_9GAMM
MRLEQLQQALDEALQGRSEPALQHLVSSRRLSSTECLELYRQLLLSAHLRTLQRLFPACARLLGRAHFQQLARHCAHCSTGPPGECMPSRLAQYLDGQPELAGMPFLPELAQLEWLLYCAWRAPDDPELNLDILTEFPEELHSEVRPIASHALRLMNSSWPVYEIWLACRQETLATATGAARRLAVHLPPPRSGPGREGRRYPGPDAQRHPAGLQPLSAQLRRAEPERAADLDDCPRLDITPGVLLRCRRHGTQV